MRHEFPIARPAARGARTARCIVAGALALACAAMAGTAAAALYKWTDANGRVVYSDQPPTGDVKTETIQGAAPPSNPNATKDMAAKDLGIRKRAAETADKDKKAETQRAEAAKRGEMCVRTQSQIRQLAAEQIALVRYNEKGEAVFVDDETRRRERADLELWVQQNNCPPLPPAPAAE